VSTARNQVSGVNGGPPQRLEVVVRPEANPKEVARAVLLVLSRLATSLELSGFGAARDTYPRFADLFERADDIHAEQLNAISAMASTCGALLAPVLDTIARIERDAERRRSNASGASAPSPAVEAHAASRATDESSHESAGFPLPREASSDAVPTETKATRGAERPPRLVSLRGGTPRAQQRSARPARKARKKGAPRKKTGE
jgi:hypothetical protein